MDVCVL